MTLGHILCPREPDFGLIAWGTDSPNASGSPRWLVPGLRSREGADADLPRLLDQFDAREVLHVTYGSVLGQPRLALRLIDLLRALPEVYALHLERHFRRHLQPFARSEPHH